MTKMTMIAEPFLTAEIEYRQHHLAEVYARSPRRFRVPRRRTLRLPQVRRRPLSVA
jgi:hypothetical protein